MSAEGEGPDGPDAPLFVGVMSGTSMDGLDVAVVRVGAGAGLSDPRAELVAFASVPYTDGQRTTLRHAVEEGGAAELCDLNVLLGRWSAAAVARVLRDAGVAPDAVAAVGSHGHTVWHRPPGGEPGATLQLGDPATLAEGTGLAVVSDFRSADVAAGGHGAPLVPWPDRMMFSVEGRSRALQNLGGVGNVTRLPPRGDDGPLVAFDTGPGNALMDAAARRATAGRLDYDRDGALAARGTPDLELLERLMAHPFLERPPPRSTGRETFGPQMVERIAGERGLEPGADLEGWTDLLATLTVFTASTVGDAYRRWVVPAGVDEVVLTGGGAHNPELVRRLRDELDPLPVRTGAEALGMDPDAREAAAFAVLAWAHQRGLQANVPEVTGASGPRVLGRWTPAPDGGAGGRQAITEREGR